MISGFVVAVYELSHPISIGPSHGWIRANRGGKSADRAIGNDVLLDWDRRRKDQSAVFSLIGLEYVNGGAAMSIAVIPSANGECAVHAERISSAPFPCSVLAQQELNGFRATRLLQNMTVYLDPKDPNSTVSLVETPPGCLVIRRYVDFNWLPPNPGPAQGQR